MVCCCSLAGTRACDECANSPSLQGEPKYPKPILMSPPMTPIKTNRLFDDGDYRVVDGELFKIIGE